MPKKLMIVFEETNETGVSANGETGKKFLVYLAGEPDSIARIKAGTPEGELTSIEFWAWKMLGILQQVMKQAGSYDPKNPLQENQKMKQ